MLEERCVMSLLRGEKIPSNTPAKDVGILLCNVQPSITTESTFKKSSIMPNCAAIGSNHIFAAQADKAVIHVYNIEKTTQEAIVPLPERVSSLTLIGKWNEPAILALGTETGRITLWELCTGRQVSTSLSHLEAVRCLTTDGTSNFLLSGSDDSNVHVWSVPKLLSVSSTALNRHGTETMYTPELIFSNHRSAITGLSVSSGHMSSSFAVSIAKDSTCMAWDFRTGNSLRVFLLPSPAISLAIDPADRVIYTGSEDGSIQKLNLLTDPSHTGRVVNANENIEAPIQPLSRDRWSSSTISAQPALTIALSYDGTTLLSGHFDGKLHSWDVGKGRYERCSLDQPGAISNIIILPPSGLSRGPAAHTKGIAIEKPKIDTFQNQGGSDQQQESSVPLRYSFKAQFTSELQIPRFSSSEGEHSLLVDFDAALEHKSIPESILERGTEVFSSLRGGMGRSFKASFRDDEADEEIRSLREQLKASRTLHACARGHMERLDREVRSLLQRDRNKELAKARRRAKQAKEAEKRRKKVMGVEEEKSAGGGVEEEIEDDNVELDSTTTDLISESE